MRVSRVDYTHFKQGEILSLYCYFITAESFLWVFVSNFIPEYDPMIFIGTL